MHQSIVTTAPIPGAGRGIAGKMCLFFTFASSPRCRGLIFRQNSGDYSCARGQIAVVLPTVCPGSVGLIAGIFWTKVKDPAIPLRGGRGGKRGGGVVTKNWCINHHEG